MSVGMLGKKCGMTRVFTDDGVSIPVTVIEIRGNRVSQVKTVENDGYRSIQVVVGEKKSSRVNKPLAGHLSKAGVEAGRVMREFRLDEDQLADVKSGDELSVESLFTEGQYVDIRGVTKGKGFAGCVKRHHFKMQDATHGNSLSHRAPGSIGQCQTPGRVFKGKKMAGQMGNVNKTVQNQPIVRIDLDKQVLLIKGAVPGAPGSYVVVKPSVKAKGDKS